MAKLEAQKYSEDVCTQDHSGQLPTELIESLPMTERHPVRGRCAACAYNAGMSEAGKDVGALVAQIKALTEANDGLRAELAAKS